MSQLRLSRSRCLHKSSRCLVLLCGDHAHREFVLKLCLGPWDADHRDGFRREVLLTKHLRKTGFPTLDVEKHSSVEPGAHLWMLTRYVKASPWTPRHGIQVAGEALQRILSHLPEDRPQSRYLRWDTGDFSWYARRVSHSLTGLGDLTDEAIPHRVWDQLCQRAVLLDQHSCFFAHGDFSASHILVADGRPLIFDWEHAHQNNCALDAAHLYVDLYPLCPKSAEQWREVAHKSAPKGEPFDDLFVPAVIERALGKMNAARERRELLATLTALLQRFTRVLR